MEIQITDFENAAFSVFVVLITRAILTFNLNFYLPIPRTTENMDIAHRRDAVLNDKFYFRKDPIPRRSNRMNGSSAPPSGANTPTPSRPSTPVGPVEDEYELMSVDEIINGKEDGSFPGLIPLVEMYLDSLNVDVETRCELAQYLALIRGRANGELWTAAKWLRHVVREHKAYEHDSVVNEEVSYDLVKAVERVTINEARDGFGKEMFGKCRQQRNGSV
jgi:glutamate--cysteine ligase catalytic subunit